KQLRLAHMQTDVRDYKIFSAIAMIRINRRVNQTTRISPYECLFGRSMTENTGFIDDWRREKEEDLPDSEMVRMSQRYIMATREAARKAQDQSLERREQKAPKVSFKVGDMVLV
ncbi:hypothetical protein ADUPG1_005540, partial [Aduncisulcus paluster]